MPASAASQPGCYVRLHLLPTRSLARLVVSALTARASVKTYGRERRTKARSPRRGGLELRCDVHNHNALSRRNNSIFTYFKR